MIADFDMRALVVGLEPKLIVELGTGDGATAARMMSVLPIGAKLVTINWPNPPSGDNPKKYLKDWLADPRLTIVFGDTRHEAWRFQDRSIDLLFIDSTHTLDCASAEWDAYRPKLKNGATVVVDDLDDNDMRKFWDGIKYVSALSRSSTLGVFKYES